MFYFEHEPTQRLHCWLPLVINCTESHKVPESPFNSITHKNCDVHLLLLKKIHGTPSSIDTKSNWEMFSILQNTASCLLKATNHPERWMLWPYCRRVGYGDRKSMYRFCEAQLHTLCLFMNEGGPQHSTAQSRAEGNPTTSTDTVMLTLLSPTRHHTHRLSL